MNKLKFIYFDIGGVLLLDFSKNNKWYEMKKELGFTDENIPEFDNLWKQHTKRVNLDYDIDNFVSVLNNKTDICLPDNYSMLLDFIKRFNINKSMSKLVKSITHTYQLGLLTNMYPRMLSLINREKLIPQHEWNSIIDSSVVGYQKPDVKIYELAEKKANTYNDEILFIDNLNENLIIPKKRGWKTFLYNPAEAEKSTKKLAKLIGVEY